MLFFVQKSKKFLQFFFFSREIYLFFKLFHNHSLLRFPQTYPVGDNHNHIVQKFSSFDLFFIVVFFKLT